MNKEQDTPIQEAPRNKALPIIKRVAIALGFVLAFALGFTISACSNAMRSQQEEASSLSARGLSPKKGYEPIEDAPNLLDDATEIQGRYWFSSGDNQVLQETQWRDILYVPVTAGHYLYDGGTSDYNRYGFVTSAFISTANSAFVLDQVKQLPAGSVLKYYDSTTEHVRWVIDIDVDCYFVTNPQPEAEIKATLQLLEAGLAPEAYITFPDNYNPLILYGYPYEGYLFGDVSSFGGVSFVSKTLDLIFESGGVIFNRISMAFWNMYGRGYETLAGATATFQGGNDTYVGTYIQYEYWENNSRVRSVGAWMADMYFHNDNFYQGVRGHWTDDRYREIAVLDYDRDETDLSSKFLGYDVVQLLNVRTSLAPTTGVIGNEGTNVFSMLSAGFSSVAGLLNVQILPYLTLGTLLFIPLLVTIILVIVRLLQK